jgi:hypothetical protein
MLESHGFAFACQVLSLHQEKWSASQVLAGAHRYHTPEEVEANPSLADPPRSSTRSSRPVQKTLDWGKDGGDTKLDVDRAKNAAKDQREPVFEDEEHLHELGLGAHPVRKHEIDEDYVVPLDENRSDPIESDEDTASPRRRYAPSECRRMTRNQSSQQHEQQAHHPPHNGAGEVATAAADHHPPQKMLRRNRQSKMQGHARDCGASGAHQDSRGEPGADFPDDRQGAVFVDSQRSSPVANPQSHVAHRFSRHRKDSVESLKSGEAQDHLCLHQAPASCEHAVMQSGGYLHHDSDLEGGQTTDIEPHPHSPECEVLPRRERSRDRDQECLALSSQDGWPPGHDKSSARNRQDTRPRCRE